MPHFIRCEQNSAQWYELRLGRVTGSRVESIIGSPRSKADKIKKEARTYLDELVAESLCGFPTPSFETFDTKWGKTHEPIAVDEYQHPMREGARMIPVDRSVGFVVSDLHELVGCSPDGLVGENGIIEVKCPSTRKNHYRTLRTGDVPDDYFWQVQFNLMICGREWCDFVSFHPDFGAESRLAVITMFADSASQAEIEKALEVFLPIYEEERERFGLSRFKKTENHRSGEEVAAIPGVE